VTPSVTAPASLTTLMERIEHGVCLLELVVDRVL